MLHARVCYQASAFRCNDSAPACTRLTLVDFRPGLTPIPPPPEQLSEPCLTSTRPDGTPVSMQSLIQVVELSSMAGEYTASHILPGDAHHAA